MLHPLLAGRCLTPRSRLLRLGEPGNPSSTPSRSVVQSVGKATPGTRSRRAVDALIGPAPASRQEPSSGTVSMGPPPTSGRRFPVVPVAVGGAAALLLGGAAIVFLRQGGPEQPAQPPQVVVVQPERPVEPPPVKPPPPAEPQKVELMLTSEPLGAAVQLDGQPLGVTPVKLPLAPNAPPVLVTLTLEGDEAKTQQVSAANAPTFAVVLDRRPAANSPKHPKKPPQQNGSLGIKTGR